MVVRREENLAMLLGRRGRTRSSKHMDLSLLLPMLVMNGQRV